MNFGQWFTNECDEHKYDLDMSRYLARSQSLLHDGWNACAKIKDAEIAGLKKQLNAMVTSDVARNHLIEWKVSEGVKAKTKELESLSSERDANCILTAENEALKAQVEKMRDALETCDKADSFGQINCIVSNVLNTTTPKQCLADHDKDSLEEYLEISQALHQLCDTTWGSLNGATLDAEKLVEYFTRKQK